MPAAPNSASAPLLCCICHEKNTTFRYEVVYKQDNKSITILDVKGTNPEELECLTHPQGRNPDSFDSENEYYNFPARHPRHGHLRWPVWTPTNSVTNESQLSITYPDYPIHIPTLTLHRITNLLASRQRRGSITSDLRQYLNTRFPKGGDDHDLQNTIRDNLYLRTVPVTTRAPRPEERHGVDYTFLSKDEFLALEKSGDLLESGVYDGNHYGTPKPSPDSPTKTDSVIPGAHPSSEGKRKRNRSNVEAMAAKHNNVEQENERELSTNGVSPDNASGSSGKSLSENNADSGHPDSPDDDGLGPLPPNWEKAFTEKGEPYFIDHNSGTSHWLDPRLSRVQKQRPEDCDEGELPFGWERIDDPHYGTYYIDHVNRRTQYENPVLVAKAANQSADDRPFFTREPTQLRGEKLQAKLVKSTRGLGFTIVGGDDSEEEFLQIKSVVPNGPAWLDGKLKTGDVLVYVNGTCVLGFTHHDMVTMFQGIGPGEVVGLDVCRGYPLPFDPDDPNTEIVTTVAVTSPEQGEWANELERQRSTSADADTANSMPDLWRGQPQEERINNQNRPGSADLLMSDHKLENGLHNGTDTNSEISDMRFNPQDLVTIPIVKGGMGFGFTIADSAYGQKVKKILDRPRCKNLNEGDILVEINQLSVRTMSHGEVVQVLKDCARGQEAAITIQRGILSSPSKNKFKKNKEEGQMRPKSGFLFRSKTPTAELFATQEKEVVPMRPKTPIVDTRNMAQKNWNSDTVPASSPFTRNDITRASLGGNMRTTAPPQNQQQHDRSADGLMEQFSGVNISGNRSQSPGRDLDQYNYDGSYQGSTGGHNSQNYNNQYNYNQQANAQQQNYNQYGGFNGYGGGVPSGYDPGYGYSGYEGFNGGRNVPQMGYSPGQGSNGYRSGSLPRGRKESTSFEGSEPVPTNIRWPRPERRPWEDMVEITVTLLRHDSGFGFRIVGGTEEGSQVSIGHIVPGEAADDDGRLFSGDEIVAVDGQSVLGASHHVVVGMMGHAAQRGQVALTVRRRQPQEGYREGYPYDVTVSRLQNEGFGFVIISSVSRAGSTIGRIIEGSPAERCGRLQVGDRILAVNHVDINSLHHGDIVNPIKESGYSVTLTVGPPIDDTSSTASTSHREDQEVNSHLAEEDQYFAVELQP